MTARAWDVAAWMGAYPFRHLRQCSVDDWVARADRAGVARAVVSGYDQLFAQNGLECWPRWMDIIARHGAARQRLECWPVVNPTLPGQLRRLRQALAAHPARGVRLLPNYHGYRAWDRSLVEMMELAREQRLVVQVFIRIVDERWQWMLKTPAVDAAQDIAYLTSMFPSNRLLVSGASWQELTALAPRMFAHESLYADLSRLRGPVFAVDHIDQSLPLSRLLLGTLWPIQIMEASVWEITASRLHDAQQHAILHDNAAHLLNPAPGPADPLRRRPGY